MRYPIEESEATVSYRLGRSPAIRLISVVATIFALLSFPFAFDPVQDAVFGKRTGMAVELVSEIPVFDINRPLQGLRVEFQGSDLTALKKDVVVAQVQVINDGDEPITPGKTTSVDPIGFRIVGGELVRVSSVTASSEHLRKSVVHAVSNEEVSLNQGLIFEPGDFVRFDLLLVKPTGQKIDYRPIGKVGGLPKLSFRSIESNDDEMSFFERSFGGGLATQALRLAAYTLAGLGMMILLFLVGEKLGNLRDRQKLKKRKMLAESVVSNAPSGFRTLYRIFAKQFEKTGLPSLYKLRRLLENVDSEEWKAIDDFEGSYHFTIPWGPIELKEFADQLVALQLRDPKTGKIDEKVASGLERFIDELKVLAKSRGISISKLSSRDPYMFMVEELAKNSKAK